jgi:nicotinamide-nucleotide amidase
LFVNQVLQSRGAGGADYAAVRVPRTTFMRAARACENRAVTIPDDKTLSALVRELGGQLLASRRRLVTAESCTGGWIAKLCTDIPGSSEWFDCGFVCYSNAAKSRDLGVPERLIDTEGAVSDAVVRAMAEGAIERTGANVALAVSGIAGPGGAVPGKPVGTVWFALAYRFEDRLECQGHLIQFDGDRDAVRRQSVEYALNLLRGLPPLG